MFPNTRKFSSLPGALNTDEAATVLSSKRVFMYCTGERRARGRVRDKEMGLSG